MKRDELKRIMLGIKKLTFRPNAVDEILTLLFVTILHEVDRLIDGFNLVD